MATIRVRDWTKEQIEEIREEESHSSHDSVIKALLKDRELAKFAGTPVDDESKATETEAVDEPAEKPFDDLTVFAELNRADNGVLFLWCPNCGNEIAHIGVENPIDIPVFEMECQRCLSRLDQHAIVGIEIGYPIEERIVEETLRDDLKECVVDYWDRALERLADGTLNGDAVDEEHTVWQFQQYLHEFGWDWPADVPAVTLEPGRTYRNEATGERIEVLESTTDNRNAIDSYRVRRSTDDADADQEILDGSAVMNLILSRNLYAV